MTMETSSKEVSPVDSKDSYNGVKDDPDTLLLLVDKYVKVQLIKNVSYNGFIHSIDPITYSILLSVPKGAEFQLILIPGHAVTDVQEIPAGENFQPPTRKLTTGETEEEQSDRKARLIAWLKWNLLPVTDSGPNIGVQSVNILPPYTTSDIYAENPVITLQIRRIMERMPHDFVSIPGSTSHNLNQDSSQTNPGSNYVKFYE